jgi:hypothetical protein
MVESSNSKRGRRATEGVKLTGARRRCRAAPVVGEVGHASGSYSKVIGCFGHASGSCSGVGAPGPAVSGARGVDKIHRGGPFYSHTLRGGGGQRGPAQGERLRGDGSAQRQSGQALAGHRAQRGQQRVSCRAREGWEFLFVRRRRGGELDREDVARQGHTARMGVPTHGAYAARG